MQPNEERELAAAAAAKVRRKVATVFSKLDGYAWLSERERAEFRHYREVFLEAVAGIERRGRDGELRLPRKGKFPDCLPEGPVRLGLYIGSFDPFQMTHIAAALRLLAYPGTGISQVLVVPEGARNPMKPNRSEYRYRFDIMAKQLRGVFEPFVCPADLGEDADTIVIGRRLIESLAGRSLELDHIVGADVLPFVAHLLPDDLAWWNAEASAHSVDFSYRVRAIARIGAPDPTPFIRSIRERGITVDYDPRLIGLPSSTDFRQEGAFTIVFPTAAVIKHLEVIFRYSLDKPWLGGKRRREADVEFRDV